MNSEVDVSPQVWASAPTEETHKQTSYLTDCLAWNDFRRSLTQQKLTHQGRHWLRIICMALPSTNLSSIRAYRRLVSSKYCGKYGTGFKTSDFMRFDSFSGRLDTFVWCYSMLYVHQIELSKQVTITQNQAFSLSIIFFSRFLELNIMNDGCWFRFK